MKNNSKCPKGTQIQTLLFSKDNFTEKSAKSWAEHNDFKFGKTDIKENTIRIRQHSPFEYKKDSFRTIELTDGVKAVIGCPINKTSITKKFKGGGKIGRNITKSKVTEICKWYSNNEEMFEGMDSKQKYADFIADKYNLEPELAKMIMNELYAGYNDDIVYEKIQGWYPTFIKKDGGGVSEEGVNLFEDYENIPKKVQKVLDKYSQSFEDGDYEGLRLAKDELEKIDYTFDYYLDGVAYDLRKIGQKGKVALEAEKFDAENPIFKDGGNVSKGYVIASGDKKLSSVYLNDLGYSTKWVGSDKDGADKFGRIKVVTPNKIFVFRQNSWITFDSKEDAVNRINEWKDGIQKDDRYDEKIKTSLLKYAEGLKNKIYESFDNGGDVGEDKTVIAKEILRQLGGSGRLNAMTGAYNFIALPNGVSFRIKNQRANYIKITLSSLDLYDLEVGRIRGNTYKVVEEKKGLYNDMLKPAIEKATGMYLSLKDGGEIYNGWEKQPEWHGNPSLGLDSYKKIFNYKGRKIPIYLFGKEGRGKDTPTWGEDEKGNRIVTGKFDASDWSYVVSAGASSDLSHSGGFYPQTPTLKEAMDILDEKYSKGKLIYADGGGVDSVNYEESLNKMIEKIEGHIRHYKERKDDLENNRIRPSKIIGTGFKPQHARRIAFEWLNDVILKDEKDLSFLKGLLESLKEGKNIILYNIDGKGVIREVEQDGFVTVYYINGMHSAYTKETLDKIKSESIVAEKPVEEIIVTKPTREETIEAMDSMRLMLDIEPDNEEYKNSIRNLKNYLDTLPKESFTDLNNPQNINGFIYKPTGDMIRPNIYQDFNINYDDSRIVSIELWGQESSGMRDLYKIKSWGADVIGDIFSGDEQITILEKFEKGAEVLVGGKADYLSLVDISEMHKVSLDHILRQATIGMKIEREHTNDTNKVVEIVKDHLVESPDYYTKLQKIESSFENGGGVGGYWLDVPAEIQPMFNMQSLMRVGGGATSELKIDGKSYRYTYTNEKDLDTAIVILNEIKNPNYKKDMPQNLNQLKKYIEVGKLLRVSYNKNRPDWVGNYKTVAITQSNGFYLMDGAIPKENLTESTIVEAKKSWLEYPKANLISFSPFGFTIYVPDYRLDKTKQIKFLQYEYVTGQQEEILKNTAQSDMVLYNNAVKMLEFVNKVYDLSDKVMFESGGKLTPEMFDNKLDYNFDTESVSCFITAKNTGRMLMLRRADEDFKGCWALISGGVEVNELPNETIKREIQEELGVNLNYDSLIYVNATKHPDRTHHYFELSVNEEFEPVLNPENDAYMWINLSELPDNTHPLLKKYINSDVLV